MVDEGLRRPEGGGELRQLTTFLGAPLQSRHALRRSPDQAGKTRDLAQMVSCRRAQQLAGRGLRCAGIHVVLMLAVMAGIQGTCDQVRRRHAVGQ